MSTIEYAYSFNGDDFQGRYPSRKDAREAALEAMKAAPELPAAIFVGRIVPIDPQTTGHARDIIRSMADRYHNRENSNDYLLNLTAQQVADLESALAESLSAWLQRHNLAPTGFHVDAISEYPCGVGSKM